MSIRTHSDELKFVKSGKTYKAQRFCCRSRIDDRITMKSSKDLRYLAEKYCYHIDKESLLNLDTDRSVPVKLKYTLYVAISKK